MIVAFNIDKINRRNTDIAVVKGDTLVQIIKIYTDDLLLYIPDEGDSVTFNIYKKYTDTEPLFEREITDTMVFQMTAEETANLKLGNYVYTCKITFKDGTVDTFLNGNFNIVTAQGVR